MSVSLLDSVLFGGSLSTPEMRAVYEEKNYIQKIFDVEAALAAAEAELGLIPQDIARDIIKKANLDYVDLTESKEIVARTGHFLLAITKSWAKKIGPAGQYIHLGVTTQDVHDTAMVLLVRDAYNLIVADLEIIKKNLIKLAVKYKDTPMAGRTHIVHAVPITFGFKVAIWLDEVDRSLQRLNGMKERLLTGNITGAVGTFATFGEKGFEVQRQTLKRLGLNVPNTCWHAARDRFGEYMNELALTASSLSKILQQVLILMRPEIQEISEPTPAGHIGSSTMPQKINPILSEPSIALTRILRGYAHVMTESLETLDERNLSTWYAEFIIIPEGCLFMSAILHNVKLLTEGLHVYPENMLRNLLLSKGMINAENVMMALGNLVGKENAHEIIVDVTRKAWKEEKTLEEALLEHEVVRKHLKREEIRKLCDPVSYTGLSSLVVDEVVKKIQE